MRTQFVLLAAFAASLPLMPAQTIQAPFNLLYTMSNIGAIPGLASNWGAMVFDRDDPNVLLCSRWATVGVQNLFAIRVVRDAQGHVTGFSGPLTPRAQLDYIDGGLDYHPSGVMFYTRYPSFPSGNAIGQLKPGSTVPDRVDPILAPNYIGGLAIVPAGLPGAGQLKTLRWPGGQWTDASLTPDGVGTFNIVGEAQTAVLTGGPDGFVYAPRMAPLFTGADVLVAEFNLGNISTYAVDANGDPIVATRQVFASGLSSAFVMTVDPVTLDVLHAGWSGSQVHVIRGFGLPCGQCSHYGTGLPGTGNLEPVITWLGCPLAGQTTGVHVGNGLPISIGVLVVGFTQQAIPVFGGTILNEASILLPSLVSPTGTYAFPIDVPLSASGALLYFQAVGLDPGAVQGFSMSNGIAMPVL